MILVIKMMTLLMRILAIIIWNTTEVIIVIQLNITALIRSMVIAIFILEVIVITIITKIAK